MCRERKSDVAGVLVDENSDLQKVKPEGLHRHGRKLGSGSGFPDQDIGECMQKQAELIVLKLLAACSVAF